MWHQKWKDHSKLYKKKYFHSDDVIDDIIKWPQSRFSIFLYEWKNDIFRDNWRTNKDIIFKLSVLMYHWIVNTPLQTIVDCFIDDVIRFQNRSKIWTAIALSVFELEHRSKAQNVTNAHSYLCSIFKFQFHFRQKNSSRPQNGGHFENVKISNTASIWHYKWKDHPKLCKKNIFMVMTLSMTSEWPHSSFSIFLYEWKKYIFVITEEWIKISSSNLVYICNMELWIRRYKLLRIAKLMTSSGTKRSQNFELP